MVRKRFDGVAMMSHLPISTLFALSFSAACSAQRRALFVRSWATMYSYPRPIGCTALPRAWKSELSPATAVTTYGRSERMMVWEMMEPSVLA
jgi:hypothetical protein